MIIMGPGTGLGTAALIPAGDHYTPISTEAGHIRFAPANQDEWEHIASVLSRFYPFVSFEHLLSGPGLVNLYHARCISSGASYKPCQPADVVNQARGGDAICKQALSDFAAILGGFASHMALAYNALGGVYLTGGVLQKMGGDFDVSRFLKRFATNPKMADMLGQIPIKRVYADIPAFAGLQVLLRQHAVIARSEMKSAGSSLAAVPSKLEID
jgi:glucokinase